MRTAISRIGDTPDKNSAFADFVGRSGLFVTRYEEAVSALLDDRLSSDIRTALPPEMLGKLPPAPEEIRPLLNSLLMRDPPDHTRLRKLVQPSFSPRVMDALKPRIQRIVDDLLDKAEREAAARGEAAPDRRMELVTSFTYPMPVTVISDMLGIPMEDRETVQGWAEILLHADHRDAAVQEKLTPG